jgi:Protein of unknown function (DUF3761)
VPDDGSASTLTRMGRSILAAVAACALALPAQAASKKSKAAEPYHPTVTCKDGTLSAPVRGACSHHGGVGAPNETAKSKKDSSKVTPKGNGAISDKQERSEDIRQERQNHGTDAARSGGVWSGLAGRKARSPERTSRTSKSGAPTAMCKDGSTSYSHTHSGTCSGHGGVENWLR